MHKKSTFTKSKDDKILSLLLSGKAKEKYKGKQVVIFDGKAYILPENDQEAANFVAKLREKKPKTTPILTFVPREETYILQSKVCTSRTEPGTLNVNPRSTRGWGNKIPLRQLADRD